MHHFLMKQVSIWSFTIPVACICAYITVEPTNLNPLFFRSFEILSEISVVAGLLIKLSVYYQ
jgi:hypothetical protein